MEVSNSSMKRCRERFGYKGIGKLTGQAASLLREENIGTVIGEFIYDHDNVMLYNVLLYLIRENCTDERIIEELKDFDTMEV